MDRPIFYAPPEMVGEGMIELSVTESHHATRVMRLAVGDIVMVIDGIGNAYRGEISKVNYKRIVTVRTHSTVRNFGEPSVHVTIVAGLSTGYKFDTVVEKCTELGASCLVPLIAEKSKVKLDDSKRAANRVSRLLKVALAAAKQTRRSLVPEIRRPVSLVDYISSIGYGPDEDIRRPVESITDPVKLLFVPDKSAIPVQQALQAQSIREVILLVGPESGFSNNEIAIAKGAGFVPVTLGPRILQTETASSVACAVVMSALGQLS